MAVCGTIGSTHAFSRKFKHSLTTMSVDWDEDISIEHQSVGSTNDSEEDSLGDPGVLYSGATVTESISLYSGHCTLSQYVSEHTQGHAINTGWLTDGPYIVPLHLPVAVVGHRHKRIAVCDTGTTKLPLVVTVSYLLSPIFGPDTLYRRGCPGLCAALNYIVECMNTDDLRPSGFLLSVDLTGTPDSPLTCGYEAFLSKYSDVLLTVAHESKLYKVPITCPTKRYKRPCGLGSTMFTNSVVLMYPDVNQYMVSTQDRAPDQNQIGFLCPCSSSSSAALKGLVRFVCTGTVCRCYNMGVKDVLLQISDTLTLTGCSCVSPSITVSVAGLRYSICEECMECVVQIVVEASLKSPHVPTLHYNENRTTVAISFCTGTVMRQQENGQWVDNLCTQVSESRYESVLSPCASMVPFASYINPTRLGMSNVYMSQAICLPKCTYQPGLELTPLYKESCILLPDFIRTDVNTSVIPGLNLFVIFMNMDLTYEDAMVMSRSTTYRFQYRAEVTRILGGNIAAVPPVGSNIDPYSKSWWQCHFPGTITSVVRLDPDRIKVQIVCTCVPVNGDKFTTLHGQKGVITILPDSDMPCVNNSTAELVMGSSSIIKRGTVSQLLEAAYTMYVADNRNDNRPVCCTNAVSEYLNSMRGNSTDCSRILQTYEGDVKIGGYHIRRKVHTVKSSIGAIENVRANYGIIRVMQSCFLASHRMSVTSVESTKFMKRANRSSTTGGSKSLGEMEVTQLIASGLKHTILELSDRSDIHQVQVCRSCRLLSDLCECTEFNGVDHLVLPLDTIRYIYASRVVLNLSTKLA